MANKDCKYELTVGKDNTIKQFVERFYIIPRDLKFTKEERMFLEENSCYISDPDIAAGRNGYIVQRPGKKLTKEQVEQIKNDVGSQRAKAKKYGVSVGTINKIMNNKY